MLRWGGGNRTWCLRRQIKCVLSVPRLSGPDLDIFVDGTRPLRSAFDGYRQAMSLSLFLFLFLIFCNCGASYSKGN